MSKTLPDRAPRNRRFLVSLWHPPGQGGTAAETVRGVIWEADPRDPGRIAAPRSFVGLGVLPAILGGLLAEELDGDADTQEGGTS